MKRTSFSYLFFLLFFTAHLTLSSSLDCNAANRRALLRVKSKLRNPPELSTWVPGTNCCNWSGVGCTYDTNRVNSVFLLSLKVSAKLPRSLGRLTELQTILLLSMPGLYGPIDFIDLSWNRLEFDLTETVFSQNLHYLDLSHNRIKGNVPKSLQDIPLLDFLNLSYNRLCGKIPDQGFMAIYAADTYIHNKCLCGAPLPPCKR